MVELWWRDLQAQEGFAEKLHMGSSVALLRLALVYGLLSLACLASAVAAEKGEKEKPVTEESVDISFDNWDPKPTFDYLTQPEAEKKSDIASREPASEPQAAHEIAPGAETEDHNVVIVPIDPEITLAQLGPDARGENKEPRVSQMRTAGERDRVIEQAGLTAHVKKMDSLDKDLLVINARDKSIEKLLKKYPKLPADSLKKLKEIVLQETGG